MKNVNKATVLGYVAKDPQITRKNDLIIANFIIATSEKSKEKEITEWHNLVAFNKTAEVVEKYVKKGSLLYVEGKLKTDSYDKDGITRYSTKIITNEIVLVPTNSNTIPRETIPYVQQREKAVENHYDEVPF